MTSASGWILIETLAGEARQATVLSQDGKPKSWTAVSRALPSKALGDAVHRLVADTMESRQQTSMVVPAIRGDKPQYVTCIPVPGPTGAVHAVLVWHGPEDGAVPSPPFAGGFDWSSVTRVFRFTPEVAEFAHLDDRAVTAPEAFSYIAGGDDALMSLITKLLQSNPGDRWDGPMTLRTPSGPRHMHRALRSLAEPDNSTWNGVIYDVKDVEAEPTPSVETIALQSVSRASNVSIALIDAKRYRLVHWMTDPIENIAWKGIQDERDTPHPDDVLRITEAATLIRSGSPDAALAGIRLRNMAGGWTVVDARATVLPESEGPQMLLVEFRVVGKSDEPDTVPITDTGYPVE